MTSRDDEFYIGYEPTMPPGIRRALRACVVLAALLCLAVTAVVTMTQRPLAASRFAYGRTGAWSGYLSRMPAPSLLVPGPTGFTRYWLVSRGKYGAERALRGLDDGWVTVRGSEVDRDPWRMVEVASASASPKPAGAADPPSQAAGPGETVSLRGEIVDSKCFLGVMNPGERTVHRDCATRCLSGGVTPMFFFEDATGAPQLAVLVDADGAVPPRATRGHVGHAVTLEGQLFTLGGVPVLRLPARSGA